MQHGNAALTFGPPFYTGYGPWAQIPGRLLTLARLLISSSLIVQVQVFHLYEEKSVAMRSLPRHAESTRRNQLERRHDCRRASPRRGAVVDSSCVTGHLPPGEKRVTRSFASRSSSPRRSVSPASLRAVPSIFPWTTSFNPPSPSTPIPIFRRMRRPGRASAMRRSISPVSDHAPGALLLREHYLLCGASSWARNRGPGRSRGERLGAGADVK